MAITLNLNELITTVKTGLAKVRDAQVNIEANKSLLTIQFNGSAVRYQKQIPCSKGMLPAASFDAALLLKALNSKSETVDISVDGPELKFKAGRTVLKLASSPSTLFDSIEDISEAETVVPLEDGTFMGWTKKHPLYSAQSLKRSLQAVKDNIAKTELVVEAQWGKDDILKVKLVDQFHGILCLVKLPSIPTKKTVHIRLPLSSFLLLMDIKGDLYIDSTKVIVKDETQTLACMFIAAASFGSFEDMLAMTKHKHQVTLEAKDFIDAVKKVIVLTEQDDAIQFSSKENTITIATSAIKGSLRTSIKAQGSLPDKFSLPPKNLNDIAVTMSNKVQITDLGPSLVFTSVAKDITVHGAIVKLEEA